jgi:aerobic carbon-monoxide dehydrogenase medium subunit
VKPPPFEYHAPDTVDEALELLTRGEGTCVLAGGQSLVQLMKFRLAKPSVLVDVNGVSGLDVLEERDGELRVGAVVRQQRLLEDELVARWPLLCEATRFVGYKETRRRGTVGGSLAFAAPWAELTAAAVALDASVDVRSARGGRTIAAREFFHGPNRTALEPDELITCARFPPPAARSGAAFHEVGARYRDYAQLAAGAVVTVDEGGTCTAAELVLLRVADTPHRLDATEAVNDESTLQELLAGIDPPDDLEASAAHRRRLAPVLARRALRDAAERARGDA